MLEAVAAALVMAAAIIGAGSRLRRWLRLPVQPLLRLPLDWSLGSLAIAVGVLLIGLLRLWSVWTLGAVVAVGVLAGRWPRIRYHWVTVVAAAIGGVAAIPVALASPFFYDALVYHLGLPWQALLEHGLRAHPEDLFSAFPPLAQLLYAPMLAVGLDRAPALLHWCSFVAAGGAVGALARTLGAPRWAAAVAAPAFVLLPGHALVPGLPAAEGWAVAAIVSALAVTLSPRLTPGAATAAGLLVGIASANRLQGIPWSAVVLAVIWIRGRHWQNAGCGLVGWLAGSAPWWVKNLILLGDPIAPLLWHREGVATLWRDAGSFFTRAGGAVALRGLLAALAPHTAYLIPLALAATLGIALHRTERSLLGGAVVVAGICIWAATGDLPRFLAPALGVLIALAAAAARTPLSRWATALALAGALVSGVIVNLTELRRIGGLSVIARPSTVDSVWVANNPLPAFLAARALPADARVLFIGEPRGLRFPRRFSMPSQHDVSPLRAILENAKAPGDVTAALRARGFTHLLVNQGELNRLAATYPVAPWRDPGGWRRWNAFVDALGAPVVDVGRVEIFALASQSGPAV